MKTNEIIIHGLLKDEIDYKVLIERQANTPIEKKEAPKVKKIGTYQFFYSNKKSRK